MGAVMARSLLLVVLGICLTGAAAELELQLAPLEAMEKVWGGSFLQDRDCAAPVSHCDKDVTSPLSLYGECRIVWWVWVVAAALVLMLGCAVLSRICLPCCCLYSCCSGLIDCLCCCCSSRRGYRVARSS